MEFKNSIKAYLEARIGEFGQISEERKALLETIADYVRKKTSMGETAQIVCICTHNSRRSHFAQVWAQMAAYHYGQHLVKTFSGGTEATAFNPNAVRALERAGFDIMVRKDGQNPLYELKFNSVDEGILCFSKVYDHEENPSTKFLALMVCSDADANCPFIPLAEKRISTTFDDPKAADGTPSQDLVYDERCAQIAREMLYAFSKI